MISQRIWNGKRLSKQEKLPLPSPLTHIQIAVGFLPQNQRTNFLCTSATLNDAFGLASRSLILMVGSPRVESRAQEAV